ncbi:MAG: hypothetical protein WCG61_06850 [Chlorobium sp.]
MQNTTAATISPATTQQRTINIDQAVQYFHDAYGIKIAKKTIYKKRSIETNFIGRRSPLGQLVFTIAEIDAYMSGCANAQNVEA